MKSNKDKSPKGLIGKGLEVFLYNKLSGKKLKNRSKSSKFFIAICTLIIIPILNILPPEIVIFNTVTQQNIQNINVNYELKK